MKHTTIICTFASSLVLAAICDTALALPIDESGGDGYLSNQAIVELHPGFAIGEINAQYGTTTLDSIPSERLYLLQLPSIMTEQQFELLLDEDDRISCADLNFLGDAPGGSTQSFFFNVPPAAFESQYIWHRTNLPQAHKHTTGQGVIIALLDTGIDASHPVLAGRVLANGFNFIDMSPDVSDVGNGVDDDGDQLVDEMTGHGTYIAGIISHIAPGAGILPIKVLDSDGASDSFTVAKGVFHALEHGAQIINLSLGTTTENEVLELAIERAFERGAVVVGAAGNFNQEEPEFYPAADENAIGVAATDAADRKAVFSNFGEYVSVSAPGNQVVGAFPGNQFARTDGTSAACAVVAGAAALIKSRNPAISMTQLRTVLMRTARNIDSLNPLYAQMLGAGRIDIAAAVNSRFVFQGMPPGLSNTGTISGSPSETSP